MSKEDNTEPIDQNVNENNVEQNSSDVNEDNNEILAFANLVKENYHSRVCFIDIINQSKKRHVNLALILTQFFGRYAVKQIYGFLIIAITIVVIQAIFAFLWANSRITLFLGILTTVLMIAFLCVTLINIISALIDISRLKRGFCSIGYQIIYNQENHEKLSDNPQFPPFVAYKDNNDMIRTRKFPKGKKEQYLIPAILALFLDKSNPYKVTFLDAMPKDISYDNKTETFQQDWSGLKLSLFPVAMIAIYSISVYMSFLAYTALHQ